MNITMLGEILSSLNFYLGAISILIFMVVIIAPVKIVKRVVENARKRKHDRILSKINYKEFTTVELKNSYFDELSKTMREDLTLAIEGKLKAKAKRDDGLILLLGTENNVTKFCYCFVESDFIKFYKA